jgi:hypothetical protein
MRGKIGTPTTDALTSDPWRLVKVALIIQKFLKEVLGKRFSLSLRGVRALPGLQPHIKNQRRRSLG